MKDGFRCIAIACGLMLVPAMAQDPPAAEQTPAAQQTLSPEQLESLVAPIALYPDSLLSQVLVESTVSAGGGRGAAVAAAERIADGHGADRRGENAECWDPSVVALVAFPDVIKRLTEDVRWITGCGQCVSRAAGGCDERHPKAAREGEGFGQADGHAAAESGHGR